MHTLSIFLASLALTTATHLRISLPYSPALPNPSALPPSTRATLTTHSSTYEAPLRVDNTFDFRNVSSGSYLLDVHCHSHSFAPLRVDVSEGLKIAPGDNGPPQKVDDVKVWGTFRGNEWSNKGEEVTVKHLGGGVWEFDAKVQSEKEYLLERQGFSPLSILKNPMILIAGFSMLLVFGMPYLMDNMDPELKAEFEERQKSSAVSSTQAANSLQNFDAAAWLAGTSTPKRSEQQHPIERGVSR